MIHTLIIRNNTLFQSLITLTEARKVPLSWVSYEVYLGDGIRIIGDFGDRSIGPVLASVVEEFIPDTVFFLSESYPVSDEKKTGDIILPNVFFAYNPAIKDTEITADNRDTFLTHALFLENYDMQNDYDFESFGLSVGGINVSGIWDTQDEDFRTRLRLVYETDIFDADMFAFVTEAQRLGIEKKIYPMGIILSEDTATNSANVLHIIRFLVGSIEGEDIAENE